MSRTRGNSQRIQHRRGSAAEWTVNNPILFAGELGYETDTTRIKVGDGVTQWVNLAYVGQFGANELDGLTDVSITSPASGAVLRYDGTSWIDAVLSKSDVGLSNVDNTSDANKPVSTAQAAADAAVASAASSDATSKANAAQAAAIQRANHTGTQPASTITGLAAVATSGSYNDLSNKPNVISQADADARYVNITGDTMTGALTATAVTASSSGLYSVDGTTNCRIIAAAGISYFGATSNNSVHLQANNQSHVVILPSGNVGVGTNAPQARLDVLPDGGHRAMLGGGSTTGSELKLSHTGTAHFSVYNSGNSSLTFANTSALLTPNTAGTVLMTITSTGNVGIGTTIPDQRLAVSGNISCSGTIYASTSIQTSGGRALFRANNEQYGVGVAASAAGGFVYFGANNGTATPDAVISGAGGNTLMTLQNGGNVGIGTTSPTSTLHVSGNAARVRLTDTGITNASFNTLSIFAADQNRFGMGVGSSTATFSHIVIDGTTGGVGIGTTTPSGRLHVNGNRLVVDNAFAAQSAIQFSSNGTETAVFYRPASSTDMRLFVTGSPSGDVMTWTQGGNVGIGTASPTISSGVGLHLSGSTLRLGTARTPASSTATGNQGEVCWDTSYLYVCIATNTWRRIALTTW
jgi:hypothetical protein